MPSRLINNLGLIVSGQKDSAALSEITQKILPRASIKILTTDGPVCQKVVSRLRILDNDIPPYDLVLVIEDSDNKNPAVVTQRLLTSIGSNTFKFAPEIYIITQELETWLLSDESALTSVSTARGGRVISRINPQLETIQSPKEFLEDTLRGAGVAPYTVDIAGSIAKLTKIDAIAYRCPKFQNFQQLLS